MVSRENAVVLGALVVAILARSAVGTVTGAPSRASQAPLLGVAAPMVVNEYLDRRDDR